MIQSCSTIIKEVLERSFGAEYVNEVFFPRFATVFELWRFCVDVCFIIMIVVDLYSMETFCNITCQLVSLFAIKE
jgi:hypothetical protein